MTLFAPLPTHFISLKKSLRSALDAVVLSTLTATRCTFTPPTPSACLSRVSKRSTRKWQMSKSYSHANNTPHPHNPTHQALVDQAKLALPDHPAQPQLLPPNLLGLRRLVDRLSAPHHRVPLPAAATRQPHPLDAVQRVRRLSQVSARALKTNPKHHPKNTKATKHHPTHLGQHVRARPCRAAVDRRALAPTALAPSRQQH